MENKHTLCYVDEDATAIADFVGEMEPYFNVVQVQVQNNEQLNELIERLKAVQFDYLVVDYHLNQAIRLSYDGDAVIKSFTAIFKDFPCMLLSSDGKGAVTESEGVSADLVRDKSEISNLDNREVFVGRIEKRVLQYKTRLTEAEERYKELRDKKERTALTLEEEQQATKLNELLDESLDATAPMIPISVTDGERLVELIQKTDNLINKIEADEEL